MRRVVCALVTLLYTYALADVTESMLQRALKAVDLATLRTLLAQEQTLEPQEKERYIVLAQSLAAQIAQFAKDPNVFKNDAFYKSSLSNAYVRREVRKLLVGGVLGALGLAQFFTFLFARKQASELTAYFFAAFARNQVNETYLLGSPWFYGYLIVSGIVFTMLSIKQFKSSRPAALWPLLYSDACAAVGMVESMPVGEKPKIKGLS
jgi:hypothetical protein